MVKLSLVFAVFVASVASDAVPKWSEKKIGDKDYLMKEKSILQLLVHVHQPLLHSKLLEIAEAYKIENNIEMYNEKEPVITFLKLWKENRLMKRGDVFSPLDDWNLEQAAYLFEMFYYAKDWDTLYKTAVWARQNCNEGLFVYSLITALRHRSDTRALVMPPLYEIIPHMFIRSEIIEKAYEVRMRNVENVDKDIVVIPSNFSDWLHPKMTPEMRMVYFTEDVALNEWNAEINREWPWWMTSMARKSMKNSRYGEIMYYKQKQLLARYQLERLSNNLHAMQKFMWDKKMIGYAPNLRYQNGKEMPMRPDNMELTDLEDLEISAVKQMEERIQKVIDDGLLYLNDGKTVKMNSKDGVEIISQLIDQTMEGISPTMYGSLLRKLLVLVGRIVDPVSAHGMAPAALMHWETQLRDPLYYPILNRVHDLYKKHKAILTPYKKEDLIFDGVSIKTLEFDKLMTYFENFDFEINNAFDVSSWEDDKKMSIVVRQNRINFKPFTYRAMITSDKDTSAIVRLFMGPKLDSHGLELNWSEKAPYMMELDRFNMVLNAGKNKIERKSSDFSYFEEDKPSFRTLYKKVEDAIQGKLPFYIDESTMEVRYPVHLMLPKGKKNGMPYTMFLMVTPVGEENKLNKIMSDEKPVGFPFDRKLALEEFKVPNMIEKEVIIYHKKTDETHESL